MSYKKIGLDQFIIKIKRGEKIIEELKKFCIKMKIEGGFFYGLGAVDEVELAHYNVSVKKYTAKKIQTPLEMTNITGNIGICDEEIIIHAHATFSNKQMQAKAGHLVEAKVSGTAEIFLTSLPTLKKKYDQETGLKLFSLHNSLRPSPKNLF